MLRRRGVPDDAAGEVLDRLTDVGLVDDAAFAEAWVRSRHAGRGLARVALGRELAARGVSGDAVDAALATVDDDAEESAARDLVRRRAPAMARLDPEARLRRLVGLLTRRGYPPGLALRVARQELDGTEP